MAHVYSEGNTMALVLRGLAAHSAHDLPSAAMWLRMALDGSHDAVQHDAWQQLLARMTDQLPAEAATALEQGGAAGLRAYVQESSLPPCLRPPKEDFSHYKQWMRGRVVRLLGPAQATPAVVEGLLGLDAVDLDLLLQAGEAGDDRALQRRVDALHDAPAEPVLELSWEEMCAARSSAEKNMLLLTG